MPVATPAPAPKEEGAGTTEGEPDAAAPPKFTPAGVAFTADGDVLVGIGGKPNEVELYDVNSNRITKQVPRQPDPITTVAYDPRSLWGATGSASGVVQLWSLARPRVGLDEFAAEATSGAALEPLLGHSGAVTCLAIDGPGAKVASGGADGMLRLWRLARPRLVSSIDNLAPPTSAVLSVDQKQLYVGDETGVVGLWDVEKLTIAAKFEGGRDPITSLALSRDGKWLIGGDKAGLLHVWDPATRKRITSLPAHRDAIVGLALSAEGNELYTAGVDRRVRAWTFPLAILSKTARVNLDGGIAVGGSRFVTVVRSERSAVFDTLSGKDVHTLPGLGGRPNLTAASLRGDVVAASSWEGTALVGNVAQGRILSEVHRNGRAYRLLSVSPEGDAVLLVPSDGAPFLLQYPQQGPSRLALPVSRLVVSLPGQNAFIAAGEDRQVAEWQTSTGRMLSRLGTLTDPVRFLEASPAGDHVVAAGGSSVLVWTRQGDRWAEVPTNPVSGPIECLSWTADGRSIVVGLEDGRLQILSIGSKVADLAFAAESASSQRGRLAAIGRNQLLVTDGGAAREPITSRSKKFTAVCVSPRDGLVAAAEASGAVRLIEQPGQPEVVLDSLQGKEVTTLRFAPDGSRLVAGTLTGDIAAWDIPRTTATAVSIEEPVSLGKTSPDGQLLGLALENGDVRVLDAESGKKVWEWKNPCGQPVALAWSPGSTLLAVAGTSGAVEIWNVRSGASVDKQAETVGPRLAMVIAGREPAVEVVSVLKTGGVEIWEPGPKVPRRIPLEVQDLKSALFSDGGTHGLLSTARGETLLLSRAGLTIKLADVFKGEAPSAISPDGRTIAWVDDGKQVQVVPLSNQATRKTIDAGGAVKQILFCGENRLAVLGDEGKGKLWSLPTVAAAGAGAAMESLSAGRPIQEFLDFNAAHGTTLVRTGAGIELQFVRSRMLISGDGRRVNDAALLDRPARVVAARAGEAIRTIDIESWSDSNHGPTGTFDAVASTSAGDLVLVSPGDGVRRWRGAGTSGELEPIAVPEKFTRAALAEAGRDIVLLADSATYRIPPQGAVERIGGGNGLALSNGRPLVRSGDHLSVEPAADRNGTIAAGKARWAAVCPGAPGTVLAFGKGGEVFTLQLNDQTLMESGTLGAKPSVVVSDLDKGTIWSAGPAGEVWQWNVEKRQKTRLQTLPEEILCFGLDPEQRFLVAGTSGGVYLVPFSGEMFIKIPISSPGGAGAGGVTSLALLPEQRSLLSIQRGGQVQTLALPRIVHPAIPVQDLSNAVLLNATTWAWCAKGSQVHVDSSNPEAKNVVYEGARGTTVGLFTTAEDRLFALGSSGEMTEWNMRQPADKPQLWTIDRRFKKFLVQPASRRLVLASAAGGGLIVDLAAKSVLDQLPEGDALVDPIAFPDATRIAVIAGDSLGILPINSLRSVDVEGRDIAGMLNVSGSTDLFLATGGSTLGVTRCDSTTGELAATLQLPTPAQEIVPLGDDPSRAIVVARPDNGRSTVVLADLLGGKIVWQRAVEGEVTCVWANKQQAVVGTKSGLLHVLNCATGDLSQAFQSEPARSVAALQDGNTFLIVTESGRLVVTESSIIRSLKGAERAVTAVALNPSGEYAATGDEDGNVVLWNLANGTEAARCEGLKGPVSSLIFSEDARRLAAAGLDKNAALWNLSEIKTGDKVQPVKLFEHPGPVRTVAISRNAEKVVTSADDNVIRVWDVASGFESEQYLGHETPPLALCLATGAEEIILSYDAGGALRKWSRSKVDVAKVAAAAPRPDEPSPDGPAPPPPPPVQVKASETVAIAVKPAERLEVGRGAAAAGASPSDDDSRPISLFGGLAAARRRAPESTMRTAIGSQLQETVGALRTETNDGRKEALRQKAATLLDRLNAIKPSSGQSLSDEGEESTQVQAQGEGAGSIVPTELVLGTDRIPSPLTAQQVVAIRTAYNFTPKRFLQVKMCITSDGKTILAMQPAFPGLEGPPPPVIPEDADEATRELILRRAAAMASRLTQGVVEAWDVATRLRLRRWTQVASMDARFVGLTPDESTLYTLPDLFAFDMATGEHRQVATGVLFANVQTRGLSLACIAPRGQVGATSEILQLLNGNTLMPVEPVVRGFEAYVTAMAFAPDGSRLIASVRERQRHRLVELDPQTFREIAVLETVPYTTPWSTEEPRLGITRILFLDEGQKFVTYGHTAGEHYQFVVWDGRKRTSTHESEEPLISEDFIRAAVSIGGTTKVAFREGPRIHVVDHKKMVEDFEINLAEVHFGAPSIAVSGDGGWFASGDDGGNVAIWHLPTGIGPIMFRPHLGPIVGLDFSASGQFLATVGEENILRMWKLNLPEARGMERFHEVNKPRLQKFRKKPRATAER